ncbi:glycoside hydrolase family 92 protein, partial [Burkholderia gladioli]|nr:glycoside hydrolase family 92 protein [Burkholderia gladioli]
MKLRNMLGIGVAVVLAGCGGDNGDAGGIGVARSGAGAADTNSSNSTRTNGSNTSADAVDTARLLRSVDPIIGTANLDIKANWSSGIRGHGHTYPGATVPFGMVQLGPDTTGGPSALPWDWDRTSGYQYDDPNITGFTHTHLSGAGIGSGGE